MAAGQVAQRYAKAWLAAALEKKAMDAASADCNALLAMVKNSPDLAAFLASPLIKKADQLKVMASIAAQAKLHEITASFLATLAENRRMPALGAVLEAARAMIDAAAGVSKAHVTSATVLDEAKVKAIRDQLTKKMGHDVAVETHIDPAIMGGLVVRIGSTMIDDSVKTKLDRMARRLTGRNAA